MGRHQRPDARVNGISGGVKLKDQVVQLLLELLDTSFLNIINVNTYIMSEMFVIIQVNQTNMSFQ